MKFRSSFPLFFFGIIILFTICISCNDELNNTSNVFCYNESNGITSLDPAFARDLEIMWATNQLFDGLVELDSNLNVIPSIAKSWVISEDGRTYTFTLRDSVFFHASSLFSDSTHREVIASDFVYSFNRILDPHVASPGQWIFSSVESESGNAFTALNDTTFQIRLKEPFAPFLGMLAMQYCNVVPHEVVDHYGIDFREHPIGTGPFRFAFWVENVALVFHRNPSYYQLDQQGQRLPYLDAVKIDFVKDMSVEFQGLIQGRYDFMSGLHPSFKDELLDYNGNLRKAYETSVTFRKMPFIKTDYIGFDLDDINETGLKSPLLDRRVRQALCYAINRPEMVDRLRNNSVFVADKGFVPPVLSPLAEQEYYPYNPALSNELLDEAGYRDRSTMPEITISTTSDYADLIEFIQHQWSLVGVRAQVQVMQGSTFREATANSTLPVFRKSWLADYADAENFLSIFISTNFCPAGPNYTHYNNQSFDKLYLRLRTMSDGKERQKLIAEMDSMLMNDMPVIPLYYDQVSHFTSKKISGLPIDAVNMLDLRMVRKSN